MQELVGTLNKHLAGKVTLKYAEQILHPIPQDRDITGFIRDVTMVMQDFAQPGIAAQDLGIPFATMEPGVLTGGQMPYDIKADKLEKLKANMLELVSKIDAIH